MQNAKATLRETDPQAPLAPPQEYHSSAQTHTAQGLKTHPSVYPQWKNIGPRAGC